MNSQLNLNTLIRLLENYKIIIPRIQRDYAQGRSDEHSKIVRLNLLRDIKEKTHNTLNNVGNIFNKLLYILYHLQTLYHY